MSGVLYHYTNYKALNGIIAEHELRLNNVLNMNDASEMKYFMDALCLEIAERLEKASDHKAAAYVREMFEGESRNVFKYSSYAACFSEFFDDASQWERYGNSGKGVCIGFNKKILEKLTGGAVTLNKVNYRDDVKEHVLVDEFIDSLFGKNENGSRLSIESDAFKLRQALLMQKAWAYSASYKHPSFKSEKEVRLILSPYGVNYCEIKPLYHISEDRIKKYYPYNLKTMCEKAGVEYNELIVSITIGPETKQSKAILQDYLIDNGCRDLADKVIVSKCPLRSAGL